MKSIISTPIAIIAGIVVLLGSFIQIPFLMDLRSLFLDWAIILAAFMVLIGVVNISIVNISRFTAGKKDGLYGLVLFISMLVTLVLGLIFKPDHQIMKFLFNSFQLPIERSLMAVLSVSLVVATINLMHRKPGWLSITFIVTAFLVLIGTAPLPFGNIQIISGVIKPFLSEVMAASGARGILLGVALATLTMGLRILFGAERPYGGK